MSRIYWDSMLFIYLLEGNQTYTERIQTVLERMQKRDDTLCTSVFTMGEVLTGPRKVGALEAVDKVRDFFLHSGRVELLPFTANTSDRYGIIRASTNVQSADAIHLASAAESDVHLFITHDKKLQELIIPGIHFITGLDGNLP